VLTTAWRTYDRPIERIFALLDGYRQRLLTTDCQYGCPIGRLALELDSENIPAHALIAQNFTAWRDAVETCCREAGLATPADVAAFVLTVMEGAVMQSRAYRSIEPYDACIRQLRTHFAALPRARRSARAPKARPVNTSRRTR
jgi:TetR/AcrR family transcriptional repressor of nem operon